jgi:hypothetical protein
MCTSTTAYGTPFLNLQEYKVGDSDDCGIYGLPMDPVSTHW